MPELSTAGLEALRKALLCNDPRLICGTTAMPGCIALMAKSACAIGLAGWLGDGLLTVGQVCNYFNRVTEGADIRLAAMHNEGKLSSLRGVEDFIHWFDTTPREEVRAKLLAEVNLALSLRHDQGFSSDPPPEAVEEEEFAHA